MAATPSPPSEAALARFLAEASGARAVEISGLELLAGGAIQQNWGLEAEFAGGSLAGRHRLVLRTDADTGIPSSLGRIEEFAVLQAVRAAGVTVPEPVFAGADPAVIGKPFFVMRRLPGTAQGRVITADPSLEPHLPQIAARLGEELACLQTIRPPRGDLAFLPSPEESAPETQIAGFRAYLDRHPQKRPVIEWAIRWLETHIPAPLPQVLCHRDFRTGNYLLDGPMLSGILDWEFAGWGDPDEDIGWFCCKGWRFTRLDREAGGIADRATFYAGYEAASGRRLDPERVRYWEVFANVRWAIIALQQSDRYLIGGARDLSTAIIGRRATECDLELLLLLNPEDAPQTKTPSPPLGERAGVRGHSTEPLAMPSPGSPSRLATLNRNAGERLLRDRPSGLDLLELGRELLIEELLPLVPESRHREAHLIATAIAIARREALAGEEPIDEIARRLGVFYTDEETQTVIPAKAGTHSSAVRAPAGMDPGLRRDPGGEMAQQPDRLDPETLLRRFAADLRNGAFETSEPRQNAARAILWALTVAKLREGNPQFLAANGIA